MTGSEVRSRFLDYFQDRGHRIVSSSSLVPANDPTLLFTNAGMNQFKDVFLGLEKRDYNRATTAQKCVRAGGKHNDLENVGFTNRHHTFFEMLGNFSFGDYFKRDAIAYAWELVTSPKWYGIPADKLYVTIFKGEAGVPRDEEAYKHWLEQKVPKQRIYEFGTKDNFWAMGETGPCGPCSEIHYDVGPIASDQGHKDCQFGCDCGRYVEIWNLVFMQFDRDAGGTLNPLPKPSIDTGAGLDRLTAVLEGKISVYDTDLLQPLMRRAAELTGVSFEQEMKAEAGSGGAASLRVIADHARATTFLISDGVMPANDGRGYVLRKIIRRAIRHGRLLGQTEPFLNQMVFAVRDQMSGAYPELLNTADQVATVVQAEEVRFARTLDIALQKLEALIQNSSTAAGAKINGEEAFKLYDTFGLPLDFIQDAVRDAGLSFDQSGFDRAMEEQRVRAKASWKGAAKQSANPLYRELPRTEFVGYKQLSATAKVLAIISEGVSTHELAPGSEGEIVLDVSPFYAEAGGQVGDVGVLKSGQGDTVADVIGCYPPVQGIRAHRVRARERVAAGDQVRAIVNGEVRSETMRNHTATHLLHAALRETLGRHVKQAGSLVAPDRLRFDFSHFTGIADEELQDIEDLINREVLGNDRVQVIENVPIDVAINEYKAMALFGEKYGERVRVIKIGDFSTELCGGTHTAATGEIGLVKILDEGSVSSGVRRIEAVTGTHSLRHFRSDHQLEEVARGLVHFGKEPEGSLATALRREIDAREEEIKRLRRELEQVRMKSAQSQAGGQLTERKRIMKGVPVLATRVDHLDRSQLRNLVDELRGKLGSGVVAVGTADDSKTAVIVGVTADLTQKIQAGKIVKSLPGISGGGRPDMAEAGGKDPSTLDATLEQVYAVVESLL